MKLLVLALIGALTFLSVESRRVRVRPLSSHESDEDEPQQVEYYSEQEEDQGPILISRQDTYGRPSPGQSRYQAKQKPLAPRAPPVQTIRNYNKLNDDGSFTFGYEAADGSFKEETRGTDCVVRGKYGYIDPDGNKREFTYVSGNPCDPNAVQEDEEERPEADSGEENIPKGLPRRPLKPNRPTPKPSRPSTTLFQQDFNTHDDEEENVPSQRPIIQPTPSPRPFPSLRPSPTPLVRNYPIPSFAQLEDEVQPQVSRNTPRPKLLVSSPREQQVSITPRPQSNPPATTYRPQLTASPSPKSRPSQTPSSINLDEELKNFQLEHNVVSTPSPRPLKPSSADPIYTSELVYDPSSGQYNTVVYQQLPQSGGDFNLRGRLQPFVAPQSSLYRPYVPHSRPPQHNPFQNQLQGQLHAQQQNPFQGQQELFQSQQAALVQQSQQLFAQQQRRQHEQAKKIPPSLLQQEPQRFTPSPQPKPQPQHQHQPQPQVYSPQPQPFFFVAPDGERTALATGQIDAFLRGHSISI